MNAVFTQSGRAKNLSRSYLVQYSHYSQNESLPTEQAKSRCRGFKGSGRSCSVRPFL